jgi:hypothetical protein
VNRDRLLGHLVAGAAPQELEVVVVDRLRFPERFAPQRLVDGPLPEIDVIGSQEIA